jgi:hypothetical protein
MAKFKQHEAFVQGVLDLSATVASGNQFSDPSDGVHHIGKEHRKFPLMVDCKCTNSITYRIDHKFLLQWKKKTLEFGKIFALPLRFEKSEGKVEETNDCIIIILDDFREILEAEHPQDVGAFQKVQDKRRHDSLLFLEELARRITDEAIRSKAIKAVNILKGWNY